MVMLKQSFRYDQTAARLEVEGLPDFSADHGSNAIGILSSWRLTMIGAPEMEGQRDHLEALMASVIPYARLQLSGVGKVQGNDDGPVRIHPAEQGHQLELISSRSGVPPLTLQLDDADLADLVRCLDALRGDPRVRINWPPIVHTPLPKRELAERTPLHQRLAAPVLGAGTFMILGLAGLLVPIPNPDAPSQTENQTNSQENLISNPSQADGEP